MLKVMRCEICWEDDEVYTEAMVIGLIGYGYSELASCKKHVSDVNWHVGFVEYED